MNYVTLIKNIAPLLQFNLLSDTPFDGDIRLGELQNEYKATQSVVSHVDFLSQIYSDYVKPEHLRAQTILQFKVDALSTLAETALSAQEMQVELDKFISQRKKLSSKERLQVLRMYREYDLMLSELENSHRSLIKCRLAYTEHCEASGLSPEWFNNILPVAENVLVETAETAPATETQVEDVVAAIAVEAATAASIIAVEAAVETVNSETPAGEVSTETVAEQPVTE